MVLVVGEATEGDGTDMVEGKGNEADDRSSVGMGSSDDRGRRKKKGVTMGRRGAGDHQICSTNCTEMRATATTTSEQNFLLHIRIGRSTVSIERPAGTRGGATRRAHGITAKRHTWRRREYIMA